MSESISGLRRKISSAGELRSVVRTMKAVAVSNIGQYEKSVRALDEYYRTVELGLGACLRERDLRDTSKEKKRRVMRAVDAVVFGSDQGMVGQFNDVVADFALAALKAIPVKPSIWAVGERVHARILDAGHPTAGVFLVPTSAKAISSLVGQFLLANEAKQGKGEGHELHLFYNHPAAGATYIPLQQRLLPLDKSWRDALVARSWPTKSVPEVMGDHIATLRALIREYLFVSIFRACAESLASENGSRLAAMQRADKNIDDMLDELNGTFHRLRQSGIDEEMFDVISGYEALSGKKENL